MQNKINAEHQHEKKMTKRTENPRDNNFSKNRIQENTLTPHKNQPHKRRKTTKKKTPKNNQNKQYDRGKSSTNNKPYHHIKNNKTKMARTRQTTVNKNNEKTIQREQQGIKKKRQRIIAVAMLARTTKKENTSHVQSEEEDHKDTMEKNIKISKKSLTAGIKNLRKEIQERRIFIANADAANYILHFKFNWQNIDSLFDIKDDIKGRKGLFIFPTFTGEHEQGHWHTTIIER